MHLIRRAAFRAASSSSTSFVSKPRSISTTSPFLLRSKIQPSISQFVCRRFASDDAYSNETAKTTDRSSVESADSSEQSTISSAIDSATESASSYASDAAESLTHNAEEAKHTIVDTAAGVASAAGLAFGGSNPRESSRYVENKRMNPRGGYGGGRSGDGMQSRYDSRAPAADRVLVPSPTIYVGNLLFDVTAADLEKEFQQYGKINKTIIAADPRGLSKGFGYVEFETVEQATAAIEARHETTLEGRRIMVNYMAKTTRTASKNPPSKTLFIGNLAFEMSDGDLNKLFRDVRNVIDVRVAIDRRTGQPRGFAHADFVDVESAVKGMEQLNGKEIYGRHLRVDYSIGTERRVPQKGWDTNETRPGPRNGGEEW